MSQSVDTADLKFLSSVTGEIAFFRAIMRARPVGIHILWDLDALEAIELEAEMGGAENAVPVSIDFPSPVPAHSNFCREEYVLPYDSQILELMTQRRTSDKPSSISSSPSPEHVAGRTRAGLKRNKSRLQLAGLVGGDSDSSALTQDSGDESMILPTPRDGVSTVPAGEADYSGDDDAEMRDPFPRTFNRSPTPGDAAD
ncbi:hypothetical protein B0H13DRAFT_1853329 [Mycena leptocephala]|nr:hypothetical protein B0H13DRAFT_1853329 [Mycena leptocephala]